MLYLTNKNAHKLSCRGCTGGFFEILSLICSRTICKNRQISKKMFTCWFMLPDNEKVFVFLIVIIIMMMIIIKKSSPHFSIFPPSIFNCHLPFYNFLLFFSIFTPFPFFLASFFPIDKQKFPGQKSLWDTLPPAPPPPVTPLLNCPYRKVELKGLSKSNNCSI